MSSSDGESLFEKRRRRNAACLLNDIQQTSTGGHFFSFPTRIDYIRIFQSNHGTTSTSVGRHLDIPHPHPHTFLFVVCKA